MWPAALAGCGLDFVFLDTEHVPLDRAQLRWMCQTYARMDLLPLVRSPAPGARPNVHGERAGDWWAWEAAAVRDCPTDELLSTIGAGYPTGCGGVPRSATGGVGAATGTRRSVSHWMT